ncbi:MCE family protein [Antrihabitans sp. NCIMB 15449]|uniref:MCE family protein n=1 Tax=Antrihabitans spumae TaxID=3373370 RepID=A0ABW7JXQ0_9NOCA
MIIDPSGRGPTMRQLFIAGIALIVVVVLATTLLMLRYSGYFDDKVKVVAELTTTGDGLPANGDVKYRGILVGSVESVEVAAMGTIQKVDLAMRPKHIDGIPSTVTARVVPGNVFGVTSIELVDNGAAPEHLSSDTIIKEDKSKGTVALQDTLTTIRTIFTKIDPMKLGRVLGYMAEAFDGSGRVPGSTVERLDRWLTSVDAAFPDLGADLANFSAAANGLNQSAPELLDVLGTSVTTANTIAEKRGQLASILAGGAGTTDTLNELFARNPNAGKDVVAGLAPTFGALSSDQASIPAAIANLNTGLRALDATFHYGPSNQMVWSLDVSFTPFRPYTRADCPRYGDMAGPSCFTAPDVSNPSIFAPEMLPKRLDSAGPVGLPLPVGIPGIPGSPTMPDLQIPGITPAPAAAPTAPLPGAPAAPAAPVNPFQGTPLEGLFPPATPASATTSGAVQPIAYRDAGAVQAFVGKKPTASQLFLLGGAFTGAQIRAVEASSVTDGGNR